MNETILCLLRITQRVKEKTVTKSYFWWCYRGPLRVSGCSLLLHRSHFACKVTNSLRMEARNLTLNSHEDFWACAQKNRNMFPAGKGRKLKFNITTQVLECQEEPCLLIHRANNSKPTQNTLPWTMEELSPWKRQGTLGLLDNGDQGKQHLVSKPTAPS